MVEENIFDIISNTYFHTSSLNYHINTKIFNIDLLEQGFKFGRHQYYIKFINFNNIHLVFTKFYTNLSKN